MEYFRENVKKIKLRKLRHHKFPPMHSVWFLLFLEGEVTNEDVVGMLLFLCNGMLCNHRVMLSNTLMLHNSAHPF